MLGGSYLEGDQQELLIVEYLRVEASIVLKDVEAALVEHPPPEGTDEVIHQTLHSATYRCQLAGPTLVSMAGTTPSAELSGAERNCQDAQAPIDIKLLELLGVRPLRLPSAGRQWDYGTGREVM